MRAGSSRWVLAVHGGAGDGAPSRPAAEREEARRGLEAALRAGAAVLGRGGAGVDAVVAAVEVLEDDPQFNAGRGSTPAVDGIVEMDAAVADGHGRRAGAVAACRGVRHPVAAARAVMERTGHVLLAGAPVAEAAREWGLELRPDEWFAVPARRPPPPGETVGAVALDLHGHLAAATSTGGRRGQARGRVGDSPLVGAGTWADDATVAVSATGDGEAFVLAAFAHEVDARVRLCGADVAAACDGALERVAGHGGRGGCIALDAAGNLAMPFTTAAMHRGWTDASGQMETRVLRD